MKHLAVITVLAAAMAVPLPALAEGGSGSRQPAGGAHMSSYVSDPYHDPRSVYAQRRGTGQILGAPMLSEQAGARPNRRGVQTPHWANGFGR